MPSNLKERITGILKKPENERTEEDKATLAAFEDFKKRSREKLTQPEGA